MDRASDFDRRNNERVVALGAEAPTKSARAKPWLAEDVIIAQEANGYVEYDFESPVAGDAHIYCRVMDFNMGERNNSWFVVLNSHDPVS